ncbi:hypothetical protein HZA42_04110 [Candidatus Peregrinibacteria bacterium]|nr:hypothetical protein [Candidatus Peregrinibacteria bacterium]
MNTPFRQELRESMHGIMDSRDIHSVPYAMATLKICGQMAPSKPKPEWIHSTVTPAGRAISPADAAQCLRDCERTYHFAHGLKDAIKEAQNRFRGEVIRVFYAGCGPFAPLALTQTAVFSPDEIKFTALDIHHYSVELARSIAEARMQLLNPTRHI